MRDLMMTAMVPLIVLGVFGYIGAGIWLAVLGEWWTIGYGLASLWLGTSLLGQRDEVAFVQSLKKDIVE